MRTAKIDIPIEAVGMPIEDRPIVSSKMRDIMNGTVVEIINEYEYDGECMIDWEKYDYVTPVGDGDVYSWSKDWLVDIKDDAPHHNRRDEIMLDNCPEHPVVNCGSKEKVEAWQWLYEVNPGENGFSQRWQLTGDVLTEKEAEAKFERHTNILSWEKIGNVIYR